MSMSRTWSDTREGFEWAQAFAACVKASVPAFGEFSLVSPALPRSIPSAPVLENQGIDQRMPRRSQRVLHGRSPHFLGSGRKRHEPVAGIVLPIAGVGKKGFQIRIQLGGLFFACPCQSRLERQPVRLSHVTRGLEKGEPCGTIEA